MNRICVLDTGYDSYDYEIALFEGAGYGFHLYSGEPGHRQEQLRFAGDSVGILVRGTLIDREALDRMPRLKAIVRYGTGYENIDLEAARNRGIRVANVRGYATEAVSDHALALMFACVRGTGKPWPAEFGKPHRREVFEFHTKTLGIIGIGQIGSRFSKKVSPLFRETLAYDPYRDNQYIKQAGAKKTGLNDLLERCHVISIHCNLTQETRHLINADAFSNMKQVPVLINTARGPVVGGRDLLAALEAKRIHSAGLDVFEQEPPGPVELKLLEHPWVIATPHVAWYSEPALVELQRRAADNLLALLQGRNIADEIVPVSPEPPPGGSQGQ
jgi:D-3-phosphoglycerate dehydrogenase